MALIAASLTSCDQDNIGAIYEPTVANVSFISAEQSTTTEAESLTVPVAISRAMTNGTYTANVTISDATDGVTLKSNQVTFNDGEGMAYAIVEIANMQKGTNYSCKLSLSDADKQTANTEFGEQVTTTTINVMCDYNWINMGNGFYSSPEWWEEEFYVPVYHAEGTNIYRMMGQYEESIDPYEYALSIDPEDLWTNMHLADIYYDLGRYKEAIDTLEEALRNGVETSMIHTTIGDCYYRLNDLQTAEDHFNKALEINPMIGSGYAGLGYVFSDRGQSRKAIKFFEKALEYEPWETDHLYSIATDYMKLKEYDKALECLRKIQEQTPNDADAYYYIADLYGQQDKIDEAINTIKFGLLQTDNDASLLYLLAYAYFVKGCHNQGLEALDQALDADFEVWPDFLEYDRELLANDNDILQLIEQHKKNQETNTNPA